MRFGLLIFALPLAAASVDTAFFETRVRPVLAKSCYGCHGPDKQFGGLRADSRESLLQGGKRGTALIPGDSAKSLLARAIRHDGLKMPVGGKLKDAEIAAIEEWIAAGAPWPASPKPVSKNPGWYDDAARTHWSFQPVKPAIPPPVRDARWPRNEVDRFILAALETKSLAPAPPADRGTWFRRANLVLTGLPPTPAAMDAFLRDTAPRARERAIDKLIASPHFGEHWARHWLDVMRYGETRGYEWNYEIVGAWRYRDYLIRAFNDDVPYDQLVREHLAGDLLDKPRRRADGFNESLAGTAFFRLGEAGHDDCIKFREISLDVVDNQIDTLGKAFQGLTLACARCHDHKLDPIPSADYYGIFGILNSSRSQTHTLNGPELAAPAKARFDSLKRDIRAELGRVWLEQLDSIRIEPAADAKLRFDDVLFPWIAMKNTQPERFAETWSRLAARYREESTARAAFNRANFVPYGDFRQGPGTWKAEGLGLQHGASAPGDLAIATDGPAAITAILPAGLHTNTITDRWNGALRSPLLPKDKKYVSVRLMGGRLSARRTVLDNCAIGEGYKIVENPSPEWHRLDTISQEKLPAFIELITKSDNPRIPDRPGMVKATEAELAGPRSYFGAIEAVLHDTPKSPREDLSHLDRLFAANTTRGPNRNPAPPPGNALPPEPRPDRKGGLPQSLDDLRIIYRTALRAAIQSWITGQSTDADIRWIDAFLRAGLLPNRPNASVELNRLIAAYRAGETKLKLPQVLDGLADAGPGTDAPVLITGDPHAPGAVTPRHFLSRIANAREPFQSKGSGRRELAEAIATPANPLTARVMVNRIWHHLFGRGIVATTDSFGREGEKPTHPELLDYLSDRFVREGWSVKKMVRLLAVSAAFEQSSQVTPKGRELDPRNTLLHHYTLRRMPAESVRDSMLAASGRLDRDLFGASIPPPRTEPQDYRRLFAGPLDGKGRRSIYTQVTRMEGPRFLEIFDYPNPMAARGTRDRTNVPAQALAMLNDPFVLDQAATWASAVTSDGSPTAGARVDRMFRSALGRRATPEEQERFSNLALEAASLHAIPRERVLSHPDVWKDVAHAIFNLKEFLYIQ